MNRFLLLALTIGLLSPIAASPIVDPKLHKMCQATADYMGCVKANLGLSTPKSETYWLILVAGQNLQKVEMKSMDHCKEQGEKWRKDKSEGINRSGPIGRFFYCIEGK